MKPAAAPADGGDVAIKAEAGQPAGENIVANIVPGEPKRQGCLSYLSVSSVP